ncbi:putative MFS family arabinose efflux permease [Labrys wisconsinensis]|uniref:MFS family arabinose efflux permease n=1 Tax=Labrys wisconsinensis TaxID=425677 RepID=A0ABU0JNM2_9HYPH|nr:putative MFS family arabinose efflux permease [Labrys wisconsinensis]
MTAAALDDPADRRPVSARLTLLLAMACGLLAANVYYAQPLAGPIGAALGLSPAATGLVVTVTQAGYGLGLLLIVPLGDLVENRRLVLALIGAAALALSGAALSTHPAPFLASAFLIGLASVAIQVLVPYAAHMAPAAIRGQVVGNVMAGLMLGIMLARPAASFLAQLTSWHVVFVASAGVMILLALTLALTLPPRRPASRLGYGALLASMGRLALTTPVLQRRAAYHACLFGAFSLFWTTTPLLLAEVFHLTQGGIALFALAGIAGAIAAPIAGRVADRGWSRPATVLAMLAVLGAFAMTHLAPAGSPLALGGGGDPARFRRRRQRHPRPARHLRPRGGAPQPAQRALYGDLLRRRRHRLGPGRLGLCPGRMDARFRHRRRPAARRADLSGDGIAGSALFSYGEPHS